MFYLLRMFEYKFLWAFELEEKLKQDIVHFYLSYRLQVQLW